MNFDNYFAEGIIKDEESGERLDVILSQHQDVDFANKATGNMRFQQGASITNVYGGEKQQAFWTKDYQPAKDYDLFFVVALLFSDEPNPETGRKVREAIEILEFGPAKLQQAIKKANTMKFDDGWSMTFLYGGIKLKWDNDADTFVLPDEEEADDAAA